WEEKKGITKDNKQKTQATKEMQDTNKVKKRRGKENQVLQLETNSSILKAAHRKQRV
ncbi:44622_t:CDS:1, partial [Gigaspora margarita]